MVDLAAENKALAERIAGIMGEMAEVVREVDQLRTVVEDTGDVLAVVLAHYDVSDDARTQLLGAIEKITVALAGRGGHR